MIEALKEDEGIGCTSTLHTYTPYTPFRNSAIAPCKCMEP